MSGNNRLILKLGEPKTSLKLNYSNSLCLKTNSSNYLGIQKKDEKSEYGRGYNAAVKKCNKRAGYIISKMFEACQKALDQDEDCYD